MLALNRQREIQSSFPATIRASRRTLHKREPLESLMSESRERSGKERSVDYMEHSGGNKPARRDASMGSRMSADFETSLEHDQESGNRLSEKIMLKQKDEITMRFLAIAS